MLDYQVLLDAVAIACVKELAGTEDQNTKSFVRPSGAIGGNAHV